MVEWQLFDEIDTPPLGSEEWETISFDIDSSRLLFGFNFLFDAEVSPSWNRAGFYCIGPRGLSPRSFGRSYAIPLIVRDGVMSIVQIEPREFEVLLPGADSFRLAYFVHRWVPATKIQAWAAIEAPP